METSQQLAFVVERNRKPIKDVWEIKGNEFRFITPYPSGDNRHKNYHFTYPKVEFFENHLGGSSRYTNLNP